MPKIQFDVNVANAVAIDVANDVLSVWWMEVYPFCFNQSKPLFMPKNLLCSLKTTKAEIQLFGRKILATFQGMHVLPAKHSCVYLLRKCGYRTDGWTDRQLRRQNNKSLRKHNNILHNLSYIMYIFWYLHVPTCYLPFFSQLGERKRTIRATG